MPLDEQTLLAERISNGDAKAESELFSRLENRIMFMVRVRLKGRAAKETQEDIVSEIKTAVLTRLRKGGFDPARGASLQAYIAGIASNIVGQHFRKKQKEIMTTGHEFQNSIADSEDTLSEMIDEERDEKLRRCLSKLKPKYKEILLLRIYEKKSIGQIADELNLERRRVSERIHYAFKLLLKACREDNYFQYYEESDKQL